MSEDREAWGTLLEAGFLHALREAHTEATLAVFGAMSRAAGFKERSFGTGAFDVLETQLDRVFHLGEFAPDPDEADDDPLAAMVTRHDLNGSPGWRYGRYRILLKRHRFGAVRAIRWDRESFTKQVVARQEFPDDPQLSLDFGLGPVRETDDVVTLVLAHSATEEPLEMELFLGRPRLNADGGPAWHWLRQLNDDTLGADRRRRLVPSTLPLWADDEADVPLRLHGRRAGGGETSIETAQ
ncbi:MULTISPECIES: hypothetical protein [Actinoallomurus]|uniref:hypothetical protein n=1 Tax=Actinoallomurus TaxID=667113 RepID=UPI002091FA35|nr:MULTISPECIES: hypothetical protein [Actinoallomurus]MCO5968432.1 hypothetical protein [Actinoallomurus soli]MCO5995950.1 hypothetical protein [Actinoallomurus rhizosphaericola]